ERSLGIRLSIEEVPGIERIISHKLESRTMNLIGTRFGDYVDGGAGVAPIFRFKIRENSDLGNCFDRQDRRWSPEYPSFVDRGKVAVTIVHISAIEQVIISPASIAIGAEQAERARRIGGARRVACRTRNQDEQLGEVAAVNRQVHYFLRRYCSAERIVR